MAEGIRKNIIQIPIANLGDFLFPSKSVESQTLVFEGTKEIRWEL
jgi:hypothetical protein